VSATDTQAPTARLKTRYLDEIRPQLMQRFGYSSIMQAPRLQKITLNMGVGQAKQDSKVLKAAREQLATIAGQQPSVRRARKSIAAFKLREGMPVGLAVTLRGERSYEFLDRLISIAIPRIRDFRGLNPRSFDGRGNYSMGVREQIIFPEIDYDAIDEVRGLDITVTTSAATDAEAFALLLALGMPFAAQGRPAGFEALGEEHATPTKEPEAETRPEPEVAPEPDEAAAEAQPEPEAAVEAEPEPDAAADEAAAGTQPEPDAATEPAADAAEADAAAAPGESEAPEQGDAEVEHEATDAKASDQDSTDTVAEAEGG
jgi:large subunit ribosomal protein L5